MPKKNSEKSGGNALDRITHRDEDMYLTVEDAPEGYWCAIKLVARVPLPADEVHAILTDPDNYKYFRSVKALRSRQVVKDDGHGREEILVEQEGRWKFGPFSGTFAVPLKVVQDKHKRTMDFQLMPFTDRNKKQHFMREFSGGWEVAPYSSDTFDEMVRFPGRHHWSPLHHLRKAVHSLEEMAGMHADSSLVQLRQCVAPRCVPPPPLDRVMKKIAAMQVIYVMRDLKQEAERRRASREKAAHAERSKDPKGLEAHVKRL